MEQIRELVSRATAATDRDERVNAYGQLVQRFRDMACGYAYSVLGDFHLAEDAAQEAFIKAYRMLSQLRQPEAFPGWFRSIVWTTCGQIGRDKALPTVEIDAAKNVASSVADPGTMAQETEMRDEVLRAISQLPAPQREVTTLFYINGYSQNDIADFLEVPVGTVKNRLNASRSRLKERMLNMVKDTLHQNAPDERFDKKIVDELLGRPRPLEMPDHPVRRMYETLRQAFPDFEVIEGNEIMDKAAIVNPWLRQFAIEAGGERILRPETTATTFAAVVGRKAPVRLLTAGRQFRNDAEDATHLMACHGFDLVCIEDGCNEDRMKAAAQKFAEAALGPVELRYELTTLPSLKPCYKVHAEHGGRRRGGFGCGVFKPEFLANAGFDAPKVGGFAIGAVLENLVMSASGIDDIRKLWQPPYVR